MGLNPWTGGVFPTTCLDGLAKLCFLQALVLRVKAVFLDIWSNNLESRSKNALFRENKHRLCADPPFQWSKLFEQLGRVTQAQPFSRSKEGKRQCGKCLKLLGTMKVPEFG